MSAPDRVLITGGAGFVGANLALALRRSLPDVQVVCLDSLHRRGSELNLPRLREAGVHFVHGDVRDPADLQAVGPFGALVECSAEPSVMAGVEGSTRFLVHTNLFGAYNCLEEAARHGAQVVFLSTSRVYPVETLNAVRLVPSESRLEIDAEQSLPGVSPLGISEAFPLTGARTLYGATKLAAELLVAEYAAQFGLPTVVNRCGVIAGPWQMGRVDQGVFTYWMLAHHFGLPLSYIGFDGMGRQVRDLMHVEDLAELIADQLGRPEHWRGAVVNVGGGRAVSLSLRETTELCQRITGRELPVGADLRTRAGDVPVYLSDCTALRAYTDWTPGRDAERILGDISRWIAANERVVEGALMGG